MKFSTIIIIALLALIAYALLRPKPSPSALQELLRRAQQLIPGARAGDDDSQPATDKPTPTSGAQEPIAKRKSEAPAAGKTSHSQPQWTWNPFTIGDDDSLRKQYTGSVRQHLDGDCLWLRSGTRSKPDSGDDGQYVLAGFPGAADVPLDTQLDFYAYLGGVVPYENDGEVKTLSILVYSSPGDSRNQPTTQTTQTPQPAEHSQTAKPGDWMWNRKTPLDLGPYNRR